MKIKTYEIFSEFDSQIVQAENMASAIGKYGLISGNIDKELIAIIEVERGKEFLTCESLLSKCWNCQYFETRGKNYAKKTIGHCHKEDCKVSDPKQQYCDNYKQSDHFC